MSFCPCSCSRYCCSWGICVLRFAEVFVHCLIEEERELWPPYMRCARSLVIFFIVIFCRLFHISFCLFLQSTRSSNIANLNIIHAEVPIRHIRCMRINLHNINSLPPPAPLLQLQPRSIRLISLSKVTHC